MCRSVLGSVGLGCLIRRFMVVTLDTWAMKTFISGAGVVPVDSIEMYSIRQRHAILVKASIDVVSSSPAVGG